MLKNFHKTISILLTTAFIASSLNISTAQAGEMTVPLMPKPGTMVNLSPTFTPAYLKGIVIHPDNALQFDFLIDKGNGNLNTQQKDQEYTKLVKYFLAALTVPDVDQWVNLSPYEKDRIITDDFGKTVMGRDLLAQDYLLKQITSSLMYPESGIGKSFWDKVYAKTQEQFGNTNIPVNTFNKVWIVPDQAVVYESGNTAYVQSSHLKVMLEQDYLAINKNSISSSNRQANANGNREVTSQIIRQIILPELEREVNQGKNFAQLRQVFSGMILATWYKKSLKESLLGKVYADKSKINGVDQPACLPAGTQCKNNEQIYQQYLQAFKKGVYNFIKEETDNYTHQPIPRKYFAGGASNSFAMVAKFQIISNEAMSAEVKGDIALDAAQISLDQALAQASPESTLYINESTVPLTTRLSPGSISEKDVAERTKFRITAISGGSLVLDRVIRFRVKNNVRIPLRLRDNPLLPDQKAMIDALIRRKTMVYFVQTTEGYRLQVDAQKGVDRGMVSKTRRYMEKLGVDGEMSGLTRRAVLTALVAGASGISRKASGEALREMGKPIETGAERQDVVELLKGLLEDNGKHVSGDEARNIFRGVIQGNYKVSHYGAKVNKTTEILKVHPGFDETPTVVIRYTRTVDLGAGPSKIIDEDNSSYSAFRYLGKNSVSWKINGHEYMITFDKKDYSIKDQAMSSFTRRAALAVVATLAFSTIPSSDAQAQAEARPIASYPEAVATVDMLTKLLEGNGNNIVEGKDVFEKEIRYIFKPIEYRNSKVRWTKAIEISSGSFDAGTKPVFISYTFDLDSRQQQVNTTFISTANILYVNDRTRLLRINGHQFIITFDGKTYSINDQAMAVKANISDLGGIDMNAANMDLQIKRDGKGVPLPASMQDMAQLSRIEGFVPRILGIQPAALLPVFQSSSPSK